MNRHSAPRPAPPHGLRRRAYDQIDPRARQGRGLSAFNKAIIALVLLATVIAVLETEPALAHRYGVPFAVTEIVLGVIFAIEYALRLWSAPERNPTRSPWAERVRFAISPVAIADLAAVVASLAVVGGSSALMVRLVRVARILRLAKLGRMSRAFDHMVEAISLRRDELLLSLAAGLFLMIMAATALYIVEGAVQPDKFGSIPRALWWSVATMTTIGYGDVYPVTGLGKFLAAVTAIISIGFIAMPTGILAASFSDAMQRHRQAMEGAPAHRDDGAEGC
jgi:voltage-gated potassium channel